MRCERQSWKKNLGEKGNRMTDDNIPIKSVDAVKQYVELTKQMIKRIESGDVRHGDPNLESLKDALKDLNRTLEDLKN